MKQLLLSPVDITITWLLFRAVFGTRCSKYGTKCKLTCDVKASTFSGSGAANTLLGGTNNVSDGKVVVNGADTPSGYKADSIEMTYYSSLTQKTYKIKGFRRTGWPEDE